MKHKLIYILTTLLVGSVYGASVVESKAISSTTPVMPPRNLPTKVVDSESKPAAAPVVNDSEVSNSSNSAQSNSSSAKGLSPDKVVLNFENADIQTVIKAISQLSGKNFVIDPRVKGTINIVSDKPISKSDSYKVLESALRMQGFATVEADGVIKVLPEAEAKSFGMKTFSNTEPVLGKKNPGDQVVTKVFVVEHGSAMQMSNAIRPIIAPNNSVVVYPNSNALVVTDYSSNIVRISKIIDQLSGVQNGVQPKPTLLTFKHAIAADVAQVLQSYIQGGGSAGGGGSGGGGSFGNEGPNVTITVQSQTNSILMYSSSREKIKELTDIAMNMDKTVGDNHGDLHVVYLKNADASHIADVLRVVATGQENPDITATSPNSKFLNEPSGIFNTSGSSGSGGGGSSSSMSSTARSSSSRGSSGQSANAQKDQPKVFIQAEPSTNSLIIEAPEALYHNLRMIIDMLDVRRAQVMIEAMIAEINATNSGTFGIQWLVGGGNNNAGVITATNYAGNGSSLSSLATTAVTATQAASGGGASGAGGIAIPNEVYVGLVTGTTTIGGATIPNLGALADMIAATSAGNILSRPTLITLDNEEARIQVGSNVGIPNGSFTATSGSPGNLTTTITRQDLGEFLQIKPKITQSGAIQLDIYQEDSQLDPNIPVSSTNGPSFLKRTMRSMILVDDGQIIALGGMTQDSITLQQNGIPLLSSIPYLGWLFSWQSRSHSKTNIVLFLRPVIIKNAEGYKALTNQRYQYVTGQQDMVQAKGNILLPDIKPVTLDSQVPYDNTVPNQAGSNQVTTPLVDVRPSAVANKPTTTVMPNVPGTNISALPSDATAPVTVTNVNK